MMTGMIVAGVVIGFLFGAGIMAACAVAGSERWGRLREGLRLHNTELRRELTVRDAQIHAQSAQIDRLRERESVQV